MMASLSSSRLNETENEHLETPQTHSAPQSRGEGSESENEDKDENVVVVGRPLPECKNKAPPPFFGFWNPISYILFLWYGPILKRVRLSIGLSTCFNVDTSFVAHFDVCIAFHLDSCDISQAFYGNSVACQPQILVNRFINICYDP